ncbi:hypothetical protein PSN45_000384 [Yamadazyma tenuis]|uniref:DUF1715-domain-containing protein n=1 Tax=Candida tenuis (strain ATCC 10573 / BCRC 21748 / CBS 615 / JCM 9827 / NBRC 10315 / NRRL Y-1498 / VKM Y-70) TaxID=590646 RepID=G3B802_CANTC|nr:DUF1715-domain-containing protein [Yamadazyma tenuis ATCC 10573]EGV61697.1 DUF1715-domain-containing protein [Yamadazyma tenuis ATCC 10573]WEJ92926.1 hypothetical protein PSN45_000384 [Yamadazyma tenuis]
MNHTLADSKRRKLKDGQQEFDLDENLDSLLNLEEQYYKEGYREGQEESTKAQYLEGKEYGFQTGFQRFLVIGYIRGLVDFWENQVETYDASKSIKTHITQIRAIMEKVPLSNKDADVGEYEKVVNKARNKVRIIASLCKEQKKVSNIDQIIKEVGGEMQVSGDADEMW